MLNKVIINKKCGTITPTMCSVSDNVNEEAVFIIKDEIGYIKRVNTNPSVIVRSGIINVKNAVAFIIIVNINEDIDLMYEYFLNYYNKEEEEIINSLCIQDRIIFQFRDKYLKNAGQFVIGNNLKKQAMKYKNECLNKTNWSYRDFEVAKFIVHDKYENVVDVWNKLGE